MAIRFVHEVGHLLGLNHHHASEEPNNSPFYLSVMNYGYSYGLPPPVKWDGEFSLCNTHDECPEFLKCIPIEGEGKRCAPDCGVLDRGRFSGSSFPRFSSGELPLPKGTSESAGVPEKGFPEWFLPYLYCWSSAGKRNSLEDRYLRFIHPDCAEGRCVRCADGRCDIDWDRNGSWEGLSPWDLTGDGVVDQAELQDFDDLSRVIASGKKGLATMVKTTFLAYYSGFTKGSAGSFLPYPVSIQESHGGYVADVTNLCDERAGGWTLCRDEPRGTAALFRGPSSGDMGIQVRFPDTTYCPGLEQGMSFSVRLKPLWLPDARSPVVVLSSRQVRLLLHWEGSEGVWTAMVLQKDGKWRTLTVTDPGALGRWSRVTLRVVNGSGTMFLTVRSGDVKIEGELSRTAIAGPLCEFRLGADDGEETRLMGFLDDPVLVSGLTREL
jgi:hypothetical protein